MAVKNGLETWLAAEAAKGPATHVFRCISEYQRLYGPPPKRLIIHFGLLTAIPNEIKAELQWNYHITTIWYSRSEELWMPHIIVCNEIGNKKHAI